MSRIKYADAGMDMKKLTLFFLGKWYAALIAAIAGALLGGIIYTAVHTVPESEREYRATSKLYLDFAADETGEVYQAYNGYTWNDLMKTEPILSVTMSYLPEGYSEEEVMAATEALILSDLRLLTINITTRDPDRTDAVLAATNRSLEELGSTAKEFLQIETIQTTAASLVVADSRLVQAVVLGCVIALVIALVCMMLYYVLDDRIFVASDLRQVTDAAFLGYCKGESSGFFVDKLERDYSENITFLRQKYNPLEICAVEQGQDAGLLETERLRKADGVVVQVKYGKVHAAYLAYVLEQLAVQDCNVAGIAIQDGDGAFLRRYYGRIGR